MHRIYIDYTKIYEFADLVTVDSLKHSRFRVDNLSKTMGLQSLQSRLYRERVSLLIMSQSYRQSAGRVHRRYNE